MAKKNLADLKSSFNSRLIKGKDDLRNIADSNLNLSDGTTQIPTSSVGLTTGSLFTTGSGAIGGDDGFTVVCVFNP